MFASGNASFIGVLFFSEVNKSKLDVLIGPEH